MTKNNYFCPSLGHKSKWLIASLLIFFGQCTPESAPYTEQFYRTILFQIEPRGFTVQVNKAPPFTDTAKEGRYLIDDAIDGKYSFRITKKGYHAIDSSFVIKGEKTRTIALTLDAMTYKIQFNTCPQTIEIEFNGKKKTSEKSLAVFSSVKTGTYSYAARAKRYSPTQGVLTVGAGELATHTITLHRTPFPYGAFTDPRDNQVYPTLSLAGKVWMTKNLFYLPKIYPGGTGSNTEERYYVYGYNGNRLDEAKGNMKYQSTGALYNFPAAKAACPNGWRLPTRQEVLTLLETIEQSGKALAADSLWSVSDTPSSPGHEICSNNVTGFSLPPSGQMSGKGTFFWQDWKTVGGWWCEEGWAYGIHYDREKVNEVPLAPDAAISVRCVQN